MNYMTAMAAAFFGAVLSSLGMGGGGILLIFLTAYAGVDQLTAQGINLVFFIPVAIVSILFHAKNKLVKWKVILPMILTGAIGIFVGYSVATAIGSDLLSKLFAILLLCIGVKELFSK